MDFVLLKPLCCGCAAMFEVIVLLHQPASSSGDGQTSSHYLEEFADNLGIHFALHDGELSRP